MKYKIENRRYTGSKAKLVNWIMSLIKKECQGKIFADIFAGTGVVAAEATKVFDEIIINDFLYSNNVIYKAFFGPGEYNEKKLSKIIEKYNKINPKHIGGNYFSKNFGGKYFDRDIAKLVGYIRNDIEKNRNKLTIREYFILLTTLIYAIDKIANTVGHYDAYIKKEPLEKKLELKLIETISSKKVLIYREDTNLLAKNTKADVVYVDPPYNSRQYSRFYHLLETLIKWDNPKLYGTALKPEPENTSDYCKTKAFSAFKNLIENLDCKHIVVSYNNTYNSKSNSSRNKIRLEQIKEVLEQKGKTNIYKKKHSFFNSGKTEFPNHQEWLFITKVYEN